MVPGNCRVNMNNIQPISQYIVKCVGIVPPASLPPNPHPGQQQRPLCTAGENLVETASCAPIYWV